MKGQGGDMTGERGETKGQGGDMTGEGRRGGDGESRAV